MVNRGEDQEFLHLLQNDAVGKVSRLQLIARGVVEGFITGRHRSPFKGSSVEFAEHRQYVPGDDIRDLDWRVYGKSDRYYVKQFTEETNLRSTLLVDASGSMGYQGNRAAKVEGEAVSKFEYARFLAASLLYLLINQQDAVGLVNFDTKVRRYVPSRASARHMRVLLQEMQRMEVGGETALAPVFHDVAERIPPRGLVVVISDLFDNLAELIEAFHHFRFRKHEVVVMHVLADEEITFPFDNWSDFQDMEDRLPHTELDPASVRAEYLDNMRTFIRGIESACGQMKIDYVPMNTRVPFDIALAGFLASRNRRK